MRVTTHSGRASKDGAYSPKHNDRNYDITKDPHIDPEKTADNFTWHRYDRECPEMTFEEAEARFYNKMFEKALEEQNERHRKAGNKKRIKTMDEYRQSKQTCPDETIYQIGNKDQTIDVKILKQIHAKYANWKTKTFKNVKMLDVALHQDEPGGPHMHERDVYFYHAGVDENGKPILAVNQKKALEEMGIQRPHPEKPESRYNNAKMTYSKMCREKFFEICEEFGLEIEKEPKDPSESGLSQLEYKTRKERKKAEQAKKEAEQAKKEVMKAKAEAEKTKQELERITAGTKKETETALQQAEQIKQEAKKEAEELKQKAAEEAQKAREAAEEAQKEQEKELSNTRKYRLDTEKRLKEKEQNLKENEKSLEEKQRVLIDKETNLDQLSKQKALKMMEEMLEKSKPCNWQLSETEEKMKKYMQAIPVYQDPYHTNEWEKFVDINEENNKTARKDLERFKNYDFDL